MVGISEVDVSRQAVAKAMGEVETEYDKAAKIREAHGIAQHGIEGWRLLTENWEVTIERLRCEVDSQRAEVQWQRDLVTAGKAKLLVLRRKNRELRAMLRSFAAAAKRRQRQPKVRKVSKHDRRATRR